LASAASTLTLQQSILPDSISLLEDSSITSAETKWSSLSGSIFPGREEQHVQKEWDKPVTENHQALIMSRAAHATDKARLLAAGSPGPLRRLASRAAHCLCGSQAVGRSRQARSCSQTWMQGLRTALLLTWKSSGCSGPTWFVLSQERTQTPASSSHEQHPLQGN